MRKDQMEVAISALENRLEEALAELDKERAKRLRLETELSNNNRHAITLEMKLERARGYVDRVLDDDARYEAQNDVCVREIGGDNPFETVTTRPRGPGRIY